jgi:hypothetical protein
MPIYMQQNRHQLRFRTLPLDDVRDVLPILDTAIEQGDCAGVECCAYVASLVSLLYVVP